jgi:predicted ArsR family transcriptional regulator
MRENPRMTMSLADPAGDGPVGARRADVLSRLRESLGPLSVAQVAKATGLHVNTARFHLDRLVADGLVERTVEDRDVPGRPRILYSLRASAPGPRSFRLLAEMLTGLVASIDTAGPAVVETGRAWGRHLVERSSPSTHVDVEEGTERLRALLDDVGFRPEPVVVADGVEMRLHHCPFREVAALHADVVCQLHLGLMQGALAEVRAPLTADSLEPLVTPTMCVARLRAAPVKKSRR